jgi:hypothetical protein
MGQEFLGHDVGYWVELQRRAEALEVTDFIQEIAELRGRLSFYESRLDVIERFRRSKHEQV